MSGLKERITEKTYCFSDDERRVIIEDYLQSGATKQAIWDKYVGYGEEKGQILRWMRKLGYIADPKRKNAIFVLQKDVMATLKKVKETYSYFEYTKLQKRIEELEKQLCESELQARTWQTMIEVAERELNISIKKKSCTKPLKK
jgi:hypothetical protein